MMPCLSFRLCCPLYISICDCSFMLSLLLCKSLVNHATPEHAECQREGCCFLGGVYPDHTRGCLNVSKLSDTCHEKTDLKVFVVVIPKEGWAREVAPILLWVWHWLLENMIYEVKRLKFRNFVATGDKKSVSYQKKDGRGHTWPSFFWYDNDKDLKVCFLVTCVRNRMKWVTRPP